MTGFVVQADPAPDTNSRTGTNKINLIAMQ